MRDDLRTKSPWGFEDAKVDDLDTYLAARQIKDREKWVRIRMIKELGNMFKTKAKPAFLVAHFLNLYKREAPDANITEAEIREIMEDVEFSLY